MVQERRLGNLHYKTDALDSQFYQLTCGIAKMVWANPDLYVAGLYLGTALSFGGIY